MASARGTGTALPICFTLTPASFDLIARRKSLITPQVQQSATFYSANEMGQSKDQDLLQLSKKADQAKV